MTFCTASNASYLTFGSSCVKCCMTSCLPPSCSMTLWTRTQQRALVQSTLSNIDRSLRSCTTSCLLSDLDERCTVRVHSVCVNCSSNSSLSIRGRIVNRLWSSVLTFCPWGSAGRTRRCRAPPLRESVGLGSFPAAWSISYNQNTQLKHHRLDFF